MILEPDQRLAAEFGFDVDGSARGSLKNRQWPNGIVYYTIHSSLGKHNFTYRLNRLRLYMHLEFLKFYCWDREGNFIFSTNLMMVAFFIFLLKKEIELNRELSLIRAQNVRNFFN